MATEHNGRKIAFPDVTTFGELFPAAKPRVGECPVLLTLPSWEAGTWSDRAGTTKCYVTSYMAVDDVGCIGYRSMQVEAAPAVLDEIKSNMLHGSGDTIHFRVVVWDDGKALVMAEYSQIVGSRYLAIIDAATIPVGK